MKNMPLNAKAIYQADPEFVPFPSRRSVVHSTEGMVACTQPLAAQCGQRILQAGGNAADAAVAIAAGLNLTEPSSTGIGGDMFCLFYDAKTKKVSALNGSGRAGGKCTLELIRKSLGLRDGEVGEIPKDSVHSVTVPGAAAGWVDTIEQFGSGKLSLEQVLTPAIELGEKGFPVHELSSILWQNEEEKLRNASPNFAEVLKSDPKAPDGFRSPMPGELVKNPNLSRTFRTLAKEGKRGFYTGRIAEEIIKVCQDLGGHLELADLENHMALGSELVPPISLRFNGQGIVPPQGQDVGGQDGHGVEVWEHPPNGQGIVALMALGILEELERDGRIPRFRGKDHNSAAYLHAVIEALRIAFADAAWWVTDPEVVDVPTAALISRAYLARRAALFDPHAAAPPPLPAHGSPAHTRSDTVYFAVADRVGNGISFINSTYAGFGSGIVPRGCGFALQSRGANFSLARGHPNAIAPAKRPYHTIIPAMVTNTDDGSLHSIYGVMGGFMQPQGHVQVLLNMLAFNMTPQAALDAPRVCVGVDEANGLDLPVYLEEGIGEEVCEELKRLGHKAMIVKGYGRSIFGRGQVIRYHVEDGITVFSGGSDPRGDGGAYPG